MAKSRRRVRAAPSPDARFFFSRRGDYDAGGPTKKKDDPSTDPSFKSEAWKTQTWMSLHHFDGRTAPDFKMENFEVIVVVDEPPSCAFHMLVIQDRESLIQHAVRYSSESDCWEAFTVDGQPIYEPWNIALGSECFYHLDKSDVSQYRNNTISVYRLQRGGGVISRVKTIPVPRRIGHPKLIVRYSNCLYCVTQQNSSPSHDVVESIGVWEVDPAKGTWVHTSTSPREVMDDFRTVFPRRYLYPSCAGATVMGDMLVVQVLLEPLCRSRDDISTLVDYPAQDLYYRFADRRWFSGSRFFCFQGSKMGKGCSSKTPLDQDHNLFYPRLALRL